MKFWVLSLFSLLLFTIQRGLAEQCGVQAGGQTCPGGLCCSQWGWCGTTPEYCSDGCQSQCGGGDLGNIISRSTFDEMLKHRNDAACPAKNFYTYDAFISAAKAYPAFGNTGDDATRKREVAAFFGQTSHETTGGWDQATYCDPSPTWPCASGQKYYGRGPIQLTWNYNYGQCGKALGLNLLNDPDLVAKDPVVSFKTALWFWMTAQSPKPSCHDVITGIWKPSAADTSAGRLPGYGVITNIINGGLECGRGWNAAGEVRIGFYKRYCNILKIGYGNNLDCYNQRTFGSRLLVDSM